MLQGLTCLGILNIFLIAKNNPTRKQKRGKEELCHLILTSFPAAFNFFRSHANIY
jgi:hypothetical protein